MKPICSMIIASSLLLGGLAKADDQDIKGVQGILFRIEKDKQSAGKQDEITVKVGNQIEIDYTYPVAPPMPTSTSATSDNPAVKFDKILRIIPQKIGIGILGAFFTAESPGQATLKFVIDDSAGGGVILQVKVTVTP